MKKRRKQKTPKQLERHFRGISNHYRIAILLYIHNHTATTLDDLVRSLKGNTKTISEHTHRLVHAGLLNKHYQGQKVIHTLSPYGKKFVHFINIFSYS